LPLLLERILKRECENPWGVGEGVWKSVAGGEGVAEGDDGRE